MSAGERKLESEPNLVDDYSELCDELKAKYEMTEGDWKALLDLGMALYMKSPTESAVAAANDAAAALAALIRAEASVPTPRTRASARTRAAAVAALIRAEARVIGPAGPDAVALLRERARERIALGRGRRGGDTVAAALARP